MNNILDRWLMVKPAVRMVTELPLIILLGVLGEVFSWQKILLEPYSNIVGGVILLVGLVMHMYCHRLHKQALESSRQIDGLVQSGIFRTIRHPMYLGLILLYLGLALTWGVVWMFMPAVFFSIFTVFVAIKEESLLAHKFGRQYEDYMHKVPWRFIPNVF